jgi:chorismate synthase
MVLRFLDAGESHGKCLLGIIEGFPQGFPLSKEKINLELERRQGGYGRGDRMEIEQDRIDILSGMISGKSMGSPIGLMIKNKDWENKNPKNQEELTIPRPGHADLAGLIKYGLNNYRPILERASARKTAMRVAIGSVGQQLLDYFLINSYSHVLRIGSISIQNQVVKELEKEGTIKTIKDKINRSPVYSLDPEISKEMCQEIDQAKKKGDSLGGQLEIIVRNVPVGLGSHVFWDRKIDTRIAGALMGIPSVKAVEIGEGIKGSENKGSQVQDPIYYKRGQEKDNYSGYYREKNWAGGIEGGITNGENIVVRVYVKPIPTLLNPLPSVDIRSKKQTKANYQRSDTCVVPAISVVGEAVMNWELAVAFIEKFGGDSMNEIESNYKCYQERLKKC